MEVLCDILIEIGILKNPVRLIHTKLCTNICCVRRFLHLLIDTRATGCINQVRLIKMCLIESYKWSLHRYKTRGCIIVSATKFWFRSRKVQDDQMEVKINGTRQLLLHADGVNLLGDNTENSSYVSKEVVWKITQRKCRACSSLVIRQTCISYGKFQNHWVSGLCPASGIVSTRKHNVSETGCVSDLRWGEGDPYSIGSLRKS
jgi:hypothetical protein